MTNTSMLIMYSTVHANKYLSQTVNCSENLPAHECNNGSEVSIPFYLFCFCLQRMHRSTEDERFLENEQCQMWLERWETQAMNTPNVTLKEKRKMFLSDKTKFDVYSMITGFKVYCRTLFKNVSRINGFSLPHKPGQAGKLLWRTEGGERSNDQSVNFANR